MKTFPWGIEDVRCQSKVSNVNHDVLYQMNAKLLNIKLLLMKILRLKSYYRVSSNNLNSDNYAIRNITVPRAPFLRFE